MLRNILTRMSHIVRRIVECLSEESSRATDTYDTSHIPLQVENGGVRLVSYDSYKSFWEVLCTVTNIKGYTNVFKIYFLFLGLRVLNP